LRANNAFTIATGGAFLSSLHVNPSLQQGCARRMEVFGEILNTWTLAAAFDGLKSAVWPVRHPRFTAPPSGYDRRVLRTLLRNRFQRINHAPLHRQCPVAAVTAMRRFVSARIAFRGSNPNLLCMERTNPAPPQARRSPVPRRWQSAPQAARLEE